MSGFAEDFKSLYDEVKSMLGFAPTTTPASPKAAPQSIFKNDVPVGDGTYTAPIHGGWKSSGGFSFQPTDARHPKGHLGVDMRAPGGTAVHPMADGVVTNVGTDHFGGNIVNVQHANGVRTYYAHLGTISVQKGDKVTKESTLGTVGESGNAKGTVPHCHFQVWKDGQIRNPADFFSVPAYEPMAKTEKRWLDGAEQAANNFNVQEHVRQGRSPNRNAVASEERQQLLVACDNWEILSKKI